MWALTFSLVLTVPLLLGCVEAQRRVGASTGHTLKEVVRGLDKDNINSAFLLIAVAGHEGPGVDHGRILAVSSFLDAYTIRYCHVTEQGNYYSVRETPLANQASRSKQLPPDQLGSLQRLLSEMRKSGVEPPFDRTVLVSFSDSGHWRTETYDSSSLPLPFQAVLSILEEDLGRTPFR